MQPFERVQIAERIKSTIEAYSVKAFSEDHRKHLGASVIGRECVREIYYMFRWAKKEQFSGRMYRLFNRGHTEEARFTQWLRGIGFTVYEVNPETKKQFRISAIQGHFGGSLDGITEAPGLPFPLLVEYKTHGEKSFTYLQSKGVAVAKPEHVAQMNIYGAFYNLKYALYMAVNKNTDEIYVEIVCLDTRNTDFMLKRAEYVITTKTAPERISNTPTYIKCKFCTFNDICHKGARVEKNCRSCQHAEAAKDGAWYCSAYRSIIPEDFIPQGCNSHIGIK